MSRHCRQTLADRIEEIDKTLRPKETEALMYDNALKIKEFPCERVLCYNTGKINPDNKEKANDTRRESIIVF